MFEASKQHVPQYAGGAARNRRHSTPSAKYREPANRAQAATHTHNTCNTAFGMFFLVSISDFVVVRN